MSVMITAYKGIPESWTKARKAEAKRGAFLPAKPDVDNMIKSVLDALNGAAWKDDKQVVCVTASRFYDDVPRLEVEIEKL